MPETVSKQNFVTLLWNCWKRGRELSTSCRTSLFNKMSFNLPSARKIISCFFSFFPFCFRKMTRSRSSFPAPDVFAIFFCLFIYFLRLPRHRRRLSCRRRCHRLRLEKTLRLRRDCLPRSRSIGREAPSFLPGVHVLHHHSQLPRKSDRNFRSSPEVGDASSKSSCHHFRNHGVRYT